MAISFEPITPNLGAIVRVSAEEAVSGDTPSQISEALDRYHVLLFPQVNMTDDQLARLSGEMGDMYSLAVTGDGSDAAAKGVYEISLAKDNLNQLEYVKGNDFWHMDGTVYPAPNKATLLKCEQPPANGGDTGFANLHAAYAALPDERKQAIEGLRVVHCLAAVGKKLYEHPTEADFARWDAVFPPREHPLVWKQADGAASLVIGSTADAIVGMDEAEGRKLIDELLDWATSEQFTYRHKWSKGDLVIFNNPALLHRSYPYDEAAGRIMHRTTIKGRENTC